MLRKKKHSTADVIRHVLLAWLLAVTIEYCLLPGELRTLDDLQGLAQMSFDRVLSVTFVVSVLLFGVSRRWSIRKAERWGMVAAFAVVAVMALNASFSWALFGACVLLLAVVAVYALRGWNGEMPQKTGPQKKGKVFLWITAALATAFFLLVSIWSVSRVVTFSVPTYDFGIFAQMFHHMKTSGLPMTTLERDGLLSHFAVHVSPIYYLMLPFYWLFPVPPTLQVLQAAVLASAVIPLWKLGKHHGLSGLQRMLLCTMLLLYPAYSGGTSYDLHENCFLTPLILWLLYGLDRKNTPITAAAGLLTLTVKEDAAVYVAVAALWLLLKTLLHTPKDRKVLATGTLLLGGAIVWFAAVTGYLANSGDGVMTYRYNNFIYDDSGSLLTVIKAVLMNPMKAVYECVDGEKLHFIGLTLLPLLGLPLLTRRYERYFLLIPYFLVNLMSDYRYQHDIFFQYTFGSTAFLFYLAIVNLADWKCPLPKTAVFAVAVAISLVCFGKEIGPKLRYYPEQAVVRRDHFENIRDTLDKIPEDASVASTTYYTTYLSQREILYDIRYCTRAHLLESEFAVLKLNANSDYKNYATEDEDNGLENLITLLESHGYTQYAGLPDVLVIYRAPNTK